MELEPFVYIKNLFLNFKRNLKLETFDHGTFLYKVHELLLITLHPPIPFRIFVDHIAIFNSSTIEYLRWSYL